MSPGSSTTMINTDSDKVTLRKGVPFNQWKSSLQARLSILDVVGHVFHDVPGIDPITQPSKPKEIDEDEDAAMNHKKALAKWSHGEFRAKDAIVTRLSPELVPEDYDQITAKQLYDELAKTRITTASAPYETALAKLLETRFTATADEYCDVFLKRLQSVNNAASVMAAADESAMAEDYKVHKGQAAALFVFGTKEVEWLDIWRGTKTRTLKNTLAPLDYMMSTLRTEAGVRSQAPKIAMMAAPQQQDVNKPDPEATCRLCWHKHKNKYCYKQHPELAVGPKAEKWLSKGKGKGKAKASIQENIEDGESEYSESVNISAAAISGNKMPFIYDTGASHHFVSMKSAFINLHERIHPFRFDQAVGAMALTKEGIAHIKLGKFRLDLHNTLYSPKSSCNIISAGRLERLGGITIDPVKRFLVRKNKGQPDMPIARIIQKNDVSYILPLEGGGESVTQQIAAPGVARVPKTNNTQRWHQRLGHVGQKILKKTSQCSIGLENLDTSDLSVCETCHLSKAQRFVSRQPRLIPNSPLDEIFLDTVGPIAPSLLGHQYAVIITDAKTRMRWALAIHTKDQIATTLIQWINTMHHQYGKRIRIIFRDGGTEFTRTRAYCEQHGIQTHTSAPETPEQNGLSEAANKVILRVARSMLIDAKMPAKYWPWAVQHACFITNRLFCLRTKQVPLIDFLKSLKQPCPDKVDFNNLPQFGCRAYKLTDPKPSKFEPRACKGWFIGFQVNTDKNFIIHHPHWTPINGQKWKISFTPHATFNEDVMYGDECERSDHQQTIDYWAGDNSIFAESTTSTHQSPSWAPSEEITQQEFQGEYCSQSSSQPNSIIPDANDSQLDSSIVPRDEIQSNHQSSRSHTQDEAVTSSPMEWQRELNQESTQGPVQQRDCQVIGPVETSQAAQHQTIFRNHQDMQGVQEQTGDQQQISPPNTQQITQNLSDQEVHGPLTTYERPGSPVGLSDVMDYEPDDEWTEYDKIMTGWDPVPPIAGQKRPHSPEAETTQTRSGRNVKKLNYYRLHHGLAVQPYTDPKTWEEAMTSGESRQWRQAAQQEINSLKETGAIQIIKRSLLPKGRSPMKCKWVFKKKFLADGSIDKYKARCTAKGFTQRPGIDYQETFAPTPRPGTGRIMLVVAHQLNWHRCQGDVPTAFLNPDLNIDLFMEMPKGFERDGHIILLRKGLYGLKQAAALWYDDVKATLASLGLFPTISDVCLYANQSRDLFVVVHVDDFQILGPDIDKINDLMHALYKRYKLKPVETNLFLGINIDYPDKDTLKLTQGQYARTLLNRHGLSDCKPANRPLEQLLEPNASQCTLQTRTEYNSIVGGLQYLSNNTRPDIAFAVNHLARFLINPCMEHLQAARRVLRYIAKDPDQGITFTRSKEKPVLEAYSDADFAADPSTSRSTSGTLLRLGEGPIMWRSHLQREVVLSSTEAEFLAATETCRELNWVKSLLWELGIQDQIEGIKGTSLYVDNQSAISLTKNHDNHRRTKHVALRNFYCRNQFQDGSIVVIYVPTTNQLADALTKHKSLVTIK